MRIKAVTPAQQTGGYCAPKSLKVIYAPDSFFIKITLIYTGARTSTWCHLSAYD